MTLSLRKKNEKLFDENDLEIQLLLSDKHQSDVARRSNMKSGILKQHYRESCTLVQSALWKMKNKGLDIKLKRADRQV